MQFINIPKHTLFYKKKKAPKACKKKPARAKRKEGDKKTVVNCKKRRVGRPKNIPKIPEGVKSITTYFRSL